MEKKFVKANSGDPVYDAILYKSVDDHYDNPYLCYNDFLHKKLNELEEGKMPIGTYNDFLKKGVSQILLEKKKFDENSELLRKIERENPELLK